MITLLTFLRGGRYSSLETFSRLPEGSKLIATVNNQNDVTKVEALGGMAILVEPWDKQGGEWGRHNYVAGLWNKAIPAVTTTRVMLMDDDITPDFNSLPFFLEGFDEIDIDGRLSVYPYRDNFMGMKMFPVFYNDTMIPIDESALPKGKDFIFTGGMGMSMFRTSTLQKCLPVKIIDRFGSPSGTELDVGLKFRDLGKKIIIDGRVRCEHITP